jgi:hypothetical protein
MLEELRAMFALGADIQRRRRDRLGHRSPGHEIIPGRLQVMGPVQRKHTHLEAALRRIG